MIADVIDLVCVLARTARSVVIWLIDHDLDTAAGTLCLFLALFLIIEETTLLWLQ